MVPRILNIINEINTNYADWLACYDYAAAWFYSELTYNFPDFPVDFIQCEKDINKKDQKLSLIKDTIINGFFWMSDRCKKLYWEMDNYRSDDKGVPLKENDHLIDCLRYLYNLAGYNYLPDVRPPKDPIQFLKRIRSSFSFCINCLSYLSYYFTFKFGLDTIKFTIHKEKELSYF